MAISGLRVTASAVAVVAIGAGTASALTVAPITGGTTIEVNSGEVAVLAPLQVGRALDRIWPKFYTEDGTSLGEDTQRYLGYAASNLRGYAGIDVYGPLHNPSEFEIFWAD